MKKIRVLIPGDVLVNKVYSLIQDLADERIPARVEQDEQKRDVLLITLPGEISDDDLVKLGMYIRERL